MKSCNSAQTRKVLLFLKNIFIRFSFFFYSLIFCGRPRLDNDLRGFESLQKNLLNCLNVRMELCKYQLVYEIRFHSGVTKLYCSFALPFLSRVFLYFYGLYPAPTLVLSRFVFPSYRENRVPTKPVRIARNKTSKTKQSVK